MKVIAVDPGYDRLGVAVIEHNNGKERLLYSACIVTDKKTELPERLNDIGTKFFELVKAHNPDALAIETLFFNKNQTTAMAVAQARGAVVFIAKNSGLKVFQFGPQEVKVAVTGYGKSDKAAVIDMVKRLVPESPQKALDDEYDAIAIGITCLAHHKQ